MESRQKTAIYPELSLIFALPASGIAYTSNVRPVICAKSMCICFIRNFNDTNPPRAFRIKNKSKDDRNPFVCHTFLVSSMFLHYFFLTSVISCTKVGRGGISLYKNCLFWAFMVLHIPPIEIPTNM